MINKIENKKDFMVAMKKLMLLLLFISFAGVSNAQVNDGNWEKCVFWTFKVRIDSLKDNDGNTEKEIYQYDDKGRVLSHIIYSYEPYHDGTTKLEEMRYERKFNDAGQIVMDSEVSGYTFQDKRTYNFLNTYEYDENNRLICYTEYIPSSTSSKILYSYDVENKMTYSGYEGNSLDSLTKNYTVECTYDANHIMTMKDSCYFDGDNTDRYRFLYVYDNEGRLASDTTFVWKDSDWVYSRLTDYTYGEYGSWTNIKYNYKNGAWEPYMKNVNTYDKYNNKTEEGSYSWDGSSWTFDVGYILAYTYKEDGNPLTVELHEQIRYLGILLVDNYQKSELTYEDGKILQDIYKKKNDTWSLSNTRTYYYSDNTAPTGVESVSSISKTSDTQKIMKGDRIYICHAGNLYTIDGKKVLK